MHDKNKSSINHYLLSLKAITTLKVMRMVTVTKMVMITDDADSKSGGNGGDDAIRVAVGTTVRTLVMAMVVMAMLVIAMVMVMVW